MSKAVTVTFAPGELGRIQLYATKKIAKKTASQVRKLTGADVVINASLYDSNKWVPNCDVKADGKILNDDKYSYRGLGWNSGEGAFHLVTSAEMGKWDNFLSCVLLIWNGAAYQYHADAAVSRRGGRTVIIGLKDGTTVLRCFPDGKLGKTPAELQAAILREFPAVSWSLMLDGGGSVQLSQEGSEYIYSTRRVHNYLCFWRVDPEPKGEKPMVEINAYSKAQDGTKKLSSNFKVSEFACKDGSDAVLVAPRLVMVLQSIRSHFGSAVTINSGYRAPDYNAKVGGVAHSQHCYGTAADIVVKGKSPAQVAAYAREIMPDWGGVGIYAKQGFTHIDVREARADWTG